MALLFFFQRNLKCHVAGCSFEIENFQILEIFKKNGFLVIFEIFENFDFFENLKKTFFSKTVRCSFEKTMSYDIHVRYAMINRRNVIEQGNYCYFVRLQRVDPLSLLLLSTV